MTTSTYAVWGWGRSDDDAPKRADLEQLAPLLRDHLGLPVLSPEEPAPLAQLRDDRVSGRLPAGLAPLASGSPIDRAAHSLGRSYRDIIRGLRGRLDHVVDCVLRPASEADVVAVLDWCSSERVAVIPYSGGTSVVGGVEPRLVAEDWSGVISLDLSRMSGVAEVDETSRAARVRAGTPGPMLEQQLKSRGLTARFYPQSFERSTLGGWVATRAAGHFATRLTHIDDLVESVRAVTPAGVWESRRLPGSGAGPSPDRLLLGSEGSLGVITDAWIRVQPRPTARWAATLGAATFAQGAQVVRSLLHEGLLPATCRLIDAQESRVSGTMSTGQAALVLGFESYGAPIGEQSEFALQLCRDAGLEVVEAGHRNEQLGGAGDAWRSSFVRAPYTREQLILLGILVETFETAITWDRFDGFVADVTEATAVALRRVCGEGTVTCRLTHVYPDGAAPYFTVMAPARRGSEIAQWDEVKAAASDAVIAAGGTITHHHAVGRDHDRWYAEQRPAPFAAALAGAKGAVDPCGVLNPGVIVG